MNPPPKQSSLPRLSGLPRPSRLPVPHSAFEPPVPSIPTRYRPGTSTIHQLSSQHATTKPERPTQLENQVEAGSLVNSETNQGYIEKHSDTQDGTKQSKDAEETEPRRRPRPSLSDRTIETLSQIPPSPSPRRRKSGFYPGESLTGTPSRPMSSLGRSRPSTSLGQRPPLPGIAPRATSPTKRPVSPNKTTPNRRAVSSYVPKSVPHSSTSGKSNMVDTTPSKPSRSTNGTVLQPPATKSVAKSPSRPMGGSKTYAPRSSKPRPAVTDAFKKPTVADAGFEINRQSRRDISDISTDSGKSTNSESLFSTTSVVSSRLSATSNEGTQQSTLVSSPSSKSSAALRDVIAKAKADRRKATQSQREHTIKPEDIFDDSLTRQSNKGLLRKRIDMARTDGRLNIAAMGLIEFPNEVLAMYDLDALNTSGGTWYESVDITRLVAADNQFRSLSDNVFPDKSVEALANEDDETKGVIFAALQFLDLHGNLLEAVPVGLRQLEHLTVLNLSKNHLKNNSLETISQISSLTELRMAENDLQGGLSPAAFQLEYLEVLDIHGNRISEVPEELRDLSNLRILNLGSNQLSSLCFEAFRDLPLTELNASQNKLAGTLLPDGFDGFRSLRTFDVSGNVLTSISHDPIRMPTIQSFNASANRLTALPNVSEWTELTTLSAANNNIAAIPEGLTSLSKLRNVDFTGNDLKKLDDQIGMMESLTSFSVSNNPLRDRRFLTMSTDNLKRELRDRLLPAEPDDIPSDAHVTIDTVSQQILEAPSTWPIKPGGILDRSSTSLQDIDSAHLQPLLDTPIKSFILNHNLLTTISPAISLLGSTLTTLDLSHNRISGSSYLLAPISLPRLRELTLTSNTITSLTPLSTHLSAPALQSLNISYNRLTALPPLQNTYPSLRTILASDNAIAEIAVETARGLHVLDVSRNDIAHLEPRLGLLESEGLRMLGVGGNRFRVPRREVVEKGSAAVLEWLRGRIAEP